MENLVFVNNLLPDTNEEEVINLFRQSGNTNAESIEFITYNFMNQVIRLNCAFVTFTNHESVEKFLSPENPPIEINGHLVSLQAATDFIDFNPTAILLGDSSYLSKDILLDLFKDFNPVDINAVYSNDVQYFTIVFNTQANRDNAIKNSSHFVYKRNTYSLRLFGVYPPEKFPTVCGINKILEDGPKKKKKKLFLLKHLGQSYYIDPIIGATISGKIRKELILNPKLKELTLLSIKGNFAPLNDIFWGKKLQLTEKDNDPHFLYHMSAFLEIESLIEFFEDDYYNILDQFNAVDEVREMSRYGSGITPNIRYLASHLSIFIDDDEFGRLSGDILQLILSSKYICDDSIAAERLRDILSKNRSGSKNEGNNNSLQGLMDNEYANILSDYSIDLNTMRYKFIELFDLSVGQDPNVNT